MLSYAATSFAFLTAEEFSLLTISPLFVVKTFFCALGLIGVFFFSSDSWRGFLFDLWATLYCTLFVGVYAMAWYVRIKYETTPRFSDFGPFDWATLLHGFIKEPTLTQNALISVIFLFLTRKDIDGWIGGILRSGFYFFILLWVAIKLKQAFTFII